MYYPSSENKGADQFRGYREADLRLCFRLCRLLVFPWGGSNLNVQYEDSAVGLHIAFKHIGLSSKKMYIMVVNTSTNFQKHIRKKEL